MNQEAFRLHLLGVRGSTPASATHAYVFGGHTSSLALELEAKHVLVLDAGTGLAEPPRQFAFRRSDEPVHFDVLFTHYHWDHIAGLPFFAPLYDERHSFAFHGFPYEERGVKEILEGALCPPYFPVPFAKTKSSKRFVDLDGAPFDIGPLKISTARLKHPQGCAAYRLDHVGGSLVFVTDHEAGDRECDAALADFVEGATVLIHDAQYRPVEVKDHRGQGHSSWEDAVNLAESAGVSKLYLFHHAPLRREQDLYMILDQARARLPGVEIEMAMEGACVDF